MKIKVVVLQILSFICVALSNPGQPRIIGGDDVPSGLYPFMAAIHVQTANSIFFCGGVLLNPQWIVTSGLCTINATLFTIQLGSTNLTLPDPNRVTVSTSEYIVHPDFNPNTIDNDIGLIRLRMPVIYNDYIQPIYLASSALENDTWVTLAGWGQRNDEDGALSETLRFTGGFVLTNDDCKLIYGNQITENMGCVEGPYNEGACIGDNGGPLIDYVSRMFWLVGIISFVSGNGCESTDPTGYTRIFQYTDWIRATAVG